MAKIALLGYGKMGKIIDEVAQSRGHQILARLRETPNVKDLSEADVVIEFSNPEVAVDNLKVCLQAGVPVVCGTTGWLQHKPEIDQLTVETGGAFLYASNFSLGVNLVFKINKDLARLIKPFEKEYSCQLEEIHHTQKLDAPSGTAITLAEGVISELGFTNWHLGDTSGQELGIKALRKEAVPGTHSVFYTSGVDQIELKHTAFSREGFALGAVIASEWILGKSGVFGMGDVLGF